jgi:hypothetical protein
MGAAACPDVRATPIAHPALESIATQIAANASTVALTMSIVRRCKSVCAKPAYPSPAAAKNSTVDWDNSAAQTAWMIAAKSARPKLNKALVLISPMAFARLATTAMTANRAAVTAATRYASNIKTGTATA